MIRVIRTAVRVARNGVFATLAVWAGAAANTPPHRDPAPPQPATRPAPEQEESRKEEIRKEEQSVEDQTATETEAESDADVEGQKAAPTRVRRAARETDAPEAERAEDAAQESTRQEQHEESNSAADTLGPPGE
jgi:hypothetical protein